MKREHTMFHITAGLFGQVAIMADAGSNVEFMYQQTGTLFDTNVLIVVVIAMCNAIALAAAIKAFQQGDRIVPIALALGFFCASVFSLSATYNRVATASHATAQVILNNDDEYKALYLIYQSAVRDAGLECSPGRGGRGDNCEKAEIAVTALKEKLDRRADKLVVKLPGLSSEVTAMLPNLMAPLALYIFANCLVAFGLNGRIVRPEFELAAPDKPIDKARRFVVNYIEANGCKPSVGLVVDRTGVTAYYARKVLSE